MISTRTKTKEQQELFFLISKAFMELEEEVYSLDLKDAAWNRLAPMQINGDTLFALLCDILVLLDVGKVVFLASGGYDEWEALSCTWEIFDAEEIKTTQQGQVEHSLQGKTRLLPQEDALREVWGIDSSCIVPEGLFRAIHFRLGDFFEEWMAYHAYYDGPVSCEVEIALDPKSRKMTAMQGHTTDGDFNDFVWEQIRELEEVVRYGRSAAEEAMGRARSLRAKIKKERAKRNPSPQRLAGYSQRLKEAKLAVDEHLTLAEEAEDELYTVRDQNWDNGDVLRRHEEYYEYNIPPSPPVLSNTLKEIYASSYMDALFEGERK